MTYRALSALALLLALAGPTRPAHADWLVERYDPAATGFVPGASEIQQPAVAWRLPLGTSASSGSVLLTDVDGGTVDLVVVSQGALVARDRLNRVIWSTPNRNLTTILGRWDVDADGRDEILATRDGRRGGVFLIDAATGAIAWSREDYPLEAFDFSPRNVVVADLTGDGLPDLLVSPQIDRRLYCYSFADGVSAGSLAWSVEPSGYANLIPPLVADVLPAPGLEVVVLQNGEYRVYAGSSGAELSASGPAYHGFAFGLAQAVDVDDDALDELAIISVGHVSGYRVGVLDPADAAWLWLYEYQPDDGALRVESVPGNVGDLDGDGDLEIAVSLYNDSDHERSGYPGDELGDYDGIVAGGRWTTALFNLADGDLEVAFDGALLTAVVDVTSDGRPELVLRDAAGAPPDLDFVGETRVVALEAEGARTLFELPASDIVRVAAERQPGLAAFRAQGEPLLLEGDPVLVVYEEQGSRAERFVRVRIRGDSSLGTVVAELETGNDVGTRLLAQHDHREALLLEPESGLLVVDALLDPTSSSLTADGFLSVPGFERNDERAYLVLPGPAGSLRTFASSADSRQPVQVWRAPGLFETAPSGGRTVGGDVFWMGLERSPDGLLSLVAFEATGVDRWRYETDVSLPRPVGPVSWSPGGPVFLPLDDPSLDPDGRFSIHQLELDHGALTGQLAVPLSAPFRGRCLLVAGADGAVPDCIVSAQNAIVRVGAGGEAASIANSGANALLLAADLVGDAELEVVVSRVRFEVNPSTWGHCAYEWSAASNLWCAPERYFGESGDNPLAALPNDDGRADLVFATSVGEVRRLAGSDGHIVWSRCLSQGEASVLDPDVATPLDGGCPASALSAPVTHDLDGDGGTEILLGGRDGFLYVLSADGELEQGFDLGAPAAQPILGDLDGDGRTELVVAVGSGELVAIAQARLDPPADVREVAVDPFDATLGEVDVDEQFDFDILAARWGAVDGAGGYSLRLLDVNGLVVAGAEVDADATSHLFESLLLGIGQTYRVSVAAFGGELETSEPSLSDGVTIVDPGAPRIRDAALVPDVSGEGETVAPLLRANVSSRRGLAAFEVVHLDRRIAGGDLSPSFTRALETQLEPITDLDGGPLSVGPHSVWLVVDDVDGRSTSIELPFEVVDVAEPVLDDPGLDEGAEPGSSGGDAGIGPADVGLTDIPADLFPSIRRPAERAGLGSNRGCACGAAALAGDEAADPPKLLLALALLSLLRARRRRYRE